ncbi:BlaI/MecI/CopY family transcriptional regulator [Paenibacillus sp. URB8-2]|uniref:BlaI/MecI/CopY family transcriptional regulator n=1 Tax=Paenibacillus sp. URB8-2 TaxID=2741301 RepID=UPI0015C0B1DD|nr:BlaI/MecI/CopY family transcriptional regulator [Paenibacillus sp. URB8-2]BCG60439.1 transcriptional regulator [Paenibacillus sp. URB8-2]
MLVKRINLEGEGINRFFGSLESQIMDIIWANSKVTAKQVQSLLKEELSYNAVMTVMNRLFEKGHLKKTTVGKGRFKHSYFEPIQSKEAFINEQTRIVTEELIHDFGGLMVNHMVDAVQEADPELMKLLEARLEQWRKGVNDNEH